MENCGKGSDQNNYHHYQAVTGGEYSPKDALEFSQLREVAAPPSLRPDSCMYVSSDDARLPMKESTCTYILTSSA